VEIVEQEADDQGDDDDEDGEDAVEEDTRTGVVLGKERFHKCKEKG
jgi:hypothetical protein